MFAPIVDAIWRNVPILFDSLKKMFKKAWEQYGDTILSYVGKFLLINIGVGVIKGIAMALPAILSTLMKSLGEAILERFGAESFLKLAEKIFTQGPGKQIFSKLLNFTVIGAAIGVALSASDIDSIVGDELIKKFESGEIKNKGTIAMSKIVATLINALTFGFLSNETLSTVTSKISKFFDKYLDFIQDKFGYFTKTFISKYASGIFNIFSGIGDIIISYFSGDADRLFGGLFKIIGGIFDLQAAGASIPLMVLEYFYVIAEKVNYGLGYIAGKIVNGVVGVWESATAKLKKEWNLLSEDFWGYVEATFIDIVNSIGN
jgi:hypothetical protein